MPLYWSGNSRSFDEAVILFEAEKEKGVKIKNDHLTLQREQNIIDENKRQERLARHESIRAEHKKSLAELNPPPIEKTPEQNRILNANQENIIAERETREMFWALSWLEQNSNHLVIPGSIAMGASENLLSGGNLALITDVSDHYADYKSGTITKGQYDYRRKISLDKLKANIGPFEKWIFGNKTTNETIRIARSGGLPATANITANANKLKSLATVGKVGGIALAGVGVVASCMQIANTDSSQEKNEIFVETLFSTSVGVGAGYLVGVFLISNPVGWGTAIVLATGSAAISYASGKLVRNGYDAMESKIDFVSGLGIDGVCK
jgi:hypothetical protein